MQVSNVLGVVSAICLSSAIGAGPRWARARQPLVGKPAWRRTRIFRSIEK